MVKAVNRRMMAGSRTSNKNSVAVVRGIAHEIVHPGIASRNRGIATQTMNGVDDSWANLPGNVG